MKKRYKSDRQQPLIYQPLEERRLLASVSSAVDASENLIAQSVWQDLLPNEALEPSSGTSPNSIQTDTTPYFDGSFQTVSTTPNAEYIFSFEYKVESDSVSEDSFRIIWNDVAVGQFKSTDQWQSASLKLVADGNESRIDVREVASVLLPGGDAMGSLLTNISLTESHSDESLTSQKSVNVAQHSSSSSLPAPRVESVLVGGFGSQHLAILQSGRAITEGTAQLSALPWSGINQVAVEFDQTVSISQDDLEFMGSNTQPSILGFTYDNDSHTAIWHLSENLATDKYEFAITDRVTNVSGTRLDGEWFNGVSQTSGNGISGGDFRFQFDVQSGDLNRDGITDVKDYSLLDAEFSNAASNLDYDLNFDLAVTNADLDLLRDSFGVRRPVFGPGAHTETENLGDLNGNSVDEIAVLQTAPVSSISIYDSNSTDLINRVFLNPVFDFIDIEPIANQGVVSGIAALGVHKQTGGVRVWTWDLQSTNPTSSYPLSRSVIPADLEVLEMGDEYRLLVLGQLPGTDTARVWSIDPVTSASSSVFVASGFEALDLEVSAADGISGAEFAVSGVVHSTGGVQVRSFDAITNTRQSTISFGRFAAVDFEVFSNATTHQRNYAILRGNSNSNFARVEIKSSTGARVELKSFATDGIVKDLTQWISSEDGNEVNEIAVVTEHPDHFENRVFVSALSSTEVWEGNFGSGYRTNSLTAVSIDGEIGVVVDQINPDFGAQQIKVRIAEQNKRVINIPITIDSLTDSWFESNFVHGHTRLFTYHPRGNPVYYGTDEYDNAGEYFEELGANVFTRHARSYDEAPLWPSEVPTNADGEQILIAARDVEGVQLDALENPIQRSVNDAWASDIPLLAYYHEAGEAHFAETNPEWVCKDHNGEVASHITKGDFLDITGDYGEVTEQRLLELADMGVSGIYFDFRHLPANGCWETQLAADFTAETGLAAPSLGRTAEYQQFIEFSANRMAETFAGWKATLAAQYPQLEFIVSVTSVPGLTRLGMNTDLANIDNAKSEFAIPIARGQSNSVLENNPDLHRPADDIRMAFSWALLRDSATNGKVHQWKVWSPNGDQDKAFVSAVTTYGAIAAVDVTERILKPGNTAPGISTRAEVKETFELGDKISPHLADADPIGWAAVHFSENSRNAFFQSGDRTMWENIQLPAIGGFQALTELGMSPSVLNDSALSETISPEVQVLFLPDAGNLTAEQQTAIAAFEARGGTVISNSAGWNWSSTSGYEQAVDDFKTEILTLESRAPIVINGLPQKVHAVANTKTEGLSTPTIVVSLANDFTFVQKSFVLDPLAADQVNVTPDAVAAGVTIEIDNSFHPSLANRSASDLIAYDAVSEQKLEVVKTATGFEVVLPSFQHSIVAVIDLI